MQVPARSSVVFVAVLTLLWFAVARPLEADAHPITLRSGAHQVAEAKESPECVAFQRWLAGPISVLLTVQEAEIAGQMSSPEEQAAFRRWFWARRDPSPGTARNELRQEFYDRLSYADKTFGDLSAGKEGWPTPRGKISLLLGRPNSISESSGPPVRIAGEFRGLVIWTYGRDRTVRRGLEITFVRTPGGVNVLADARTKRAPAALLEALRDAVRATIHQPALSLHSRIRAVESVAPLSLQGTMVISQDGLEGELSLPLRELYGQADADEVRMTLNLTFGTVPPESGVATPGGRQETVASGAVVFDLSAEQLSRWSKRQLRVAFWLPYDPISDGPPPGGLVVTEGATGRQARVPLTRRRIELADHYAAEQILSVGVLSEGKGLAIAFIETAGSPGRGADYFLLARRSSEIEGEALPLPAGGLRLLRPVASDEDVS